MPQVTAGLVKELREKTGAGMMDCKRALLETEGELEAAIDWLRKKGLSAAAKKAGRTAAEGLIGFSGEGAVGALVEVNAETDFVARNNDFQAVVGEIAHLALKSDGSVAKLSAALYPGTGRTVSEEITNLVAKIGENIQLRRASVLSVKSGIIAHYLHSAVGDGLGRIGVLVAVESDASADSLQKVGRELAMHIAANSPQAVVQGDVDESVVERERQVLMDQARGEGKPEKIVAKMVEGRLRKFYEEVVLLEQTWVMDNESKVKTVLEDVSEDLGTAVAVSGFIRFQLGEGIERDQADFAAEVAAQASS